MNFVMNPLDSMIQNQQFLKKLLEKPVEVKPEITTTEEKKMVEEVAPIELKKEVLEEVKLKKNLLKNLF